MGISLRRTVFVLGFTTGLLVFLSPILAQDSTGSLGVYEALRQLGMEKVKHELDVAPAERRALEQRGAALVSKRGVSKHFSCLDCHSAEREEPDLRSPDALGRLDFLAKRRRPLLPGTSFHGMVNRESWYNGVYRKRYGDLVTKASTDLREAIQVCAEHCSQGRRLKDTELKAVLAYLWSRQYRVGDLGLKAADQGVLKEALFSRRKRPFAVRWLKDKYLHASPATGGGRPANAVTGYGLVGNPARGELVYRTSCLSCHGDRKGAPQKGSFDESPTGRRRLVANPAKFYKFLRDGSHPPEDRKGPYMPFFTQERLPNQLVEDLRAYLEGPQQVGPQPTANVAPSAEAIELRGTLQERVLSVMKARCASCHDQETAGPVGDRSPDQRKGITKVDYALSLVQVRDNLVRGQGLRSSLWEQVKPKDAFMPPVGAPSGALQPRERKVLREWILAGAPVSEEQREFVSDEEILLRIVADLVKLRPETRAAKTRYLTLTNLYNAGEPRERLELYREGLVKLLNSLSWNRRIVVPQFLDNDPSKTILRIQLDDYTWDEATWERIWSAYPYGVVYPESTAASMAYKAVGSEGVFIRGDWLAFAASKPPLYHDVLRLPGAEGKPGADLALESQLGLKVADERAKSRAVRAGVVKSGVSAFNRVVERFDTHFGSYWKSYDFGGDTGKQDIRANPLGPDPGRRAFRADGGELIFSLPNGLQAYMLIDSKGRRIDTGPTKIVQDRGHPTDSTIVNGISCMSCHDDGLLPVSDVVREHVEKVGVGREFSPREHEEVLGLYRPKTEFDKYWKEDSEQFRAALKRASVERRPQSTRSGEGRRQGYAEQVSALVQRFERPIVSLRSLAGELGVGSGKLNPSSKPAAIRNVIARIGAQGGLPRAQFIEHFRSVTRALGIGTLRNRTDSASVGSEARDGAIKLRAPSSGEPLIVELVVAPAGLSEKGWRRRPKLKFLGTTAMGPVVLPDEKPILVRCDSPLTPEIVAVLKEAGVSRLRLGKPSNLELLLELDTLVELDRGGSSLSLRGLAGHPSLRALDAGGQSAENLEVLLKIPNLRKLALRLKGDEDAGLEVIGKLRGLSQLRLDADDATNRGLQHLGNLGNLRELWLGADSEGLSFAFLRKLQRLQELFLKLRDSVLAELPAPKSLTRLVLDGPAPGTGFKSLAGRVSLKTLVVDAGISSEGLAAIGAHRSLEVLFLRGSREIRVGMNHLEPLTQLRVLRVASVDFDSFPMLRGLKRLMVKNAPRFDGNGIEGLEALESLSVSDCRRFRAEHLKALPSLSSLAIDAYQEKRDVEALGALQGLEELRARVDLRSGGLEALTRLRQLQSLDLWCYPATDATLGSLAGLPTSLRELDLFFVVPYDENGVFVAPFGEKGVRRFRREEDPLTDTTLRSLSRLIGLRKLSLTANSGGRFRFTADGFRALGRLSELKDLSLAGSNDVRDDDWEASSSGFDWLNEQTKLERLGLHGGITPLTDSLPTKLSKLPALRELSLSGPYGQRRSGRITDAGLLVLAANPHLEKLWLVRSPSLTPAGVEALEKALSSLPRLRHVTIGDCGEDVQARFKVLKERLRLE